MFCLFFLFCLFLVECSFCSGIWVVKIVSLPLAGLGLWLVHLRCFQLQRRNIVERLFGRERSASVSIIQRSSEHSCLPIEHRVIPLQLFLFCLLRFLCQTQPTPSTSSPTTRPLSLGRPPSQRSLMLPRAVSRCHGNQGWRRAPQCRPMSSRPLGASVT